MDTMKGLVGILGVAALMAVVAACGDSAGPTVPRDQATPTVAATTPTEPDPPPAADIDQALEAAEGSEVTVRGFLIADTDGTSRLCSVLLESYPPQCGGDRIELLKFDAESVPNSETPGAPGQIATARWTNSPITVTGIRSSSSGSAALAEVRLSAKDPSAAQRGGVPAATATVPPATAIDSDSEAVTGYDSLIADLRNAGASVVEATGPLTQYGFSVGGRRAVANDGTVHVFEFPSARDADIEASFISGDGWTMSVPSEGGSVRERSGGLGDASNAGGGAARGVH